MYRVAHRKRNRLKTFTKIIFVKKHKNRSIFILLLVSFFILLLLLLLLLLLFLLLWKGIKRH